MLLTTCDGPEVIDAKSRYWSKIAIFAPCPNIATINVSYGKTTVWLPDGDIILKTRLCVSKLQNIRTRQTDGRTDTKRRHISGCHSNVQNISVLETVQPQGQSTRETHLQRQTQQTTKMKMRMNASKTQTVRLRKPAGVSRPLLAARQIGRFFVAYSASPVITAYCTYQSSLLQPVLPSLASSVTV